MADKACKGLDTSQEYFDQMAKDMGEGKEPKEQEGEIKIKGEDWDAIDKEKPDHLK